MTHNLLAQEALYPDAIGHPNTFPEIRCLEDMAPAMRPEAGIKIFSQGEFVLMRYTIAMPETFRTAHDLEARSLVFDRADGRLLSRTFHKFFNLGEREGLSDLSFDTPAWLEEKLDGSMTGSLVHRGEVHFHTRGGFGKQARDARAAADAHHRALVLEAFEAGYTAIFEYTSPDNRIVVRYRKPALTLLTLRHRRTGAYNRDLARDLSHRHHQPMATILADDLSSEEDVRCRLLDLREREDIEGGVLTWPNGRRLKVKTHTYLTRHRILSDLANEREVYRCFLENTVDDAASALGGARGRALSDFVMDLHFRLGEIAEEVRVFTNSISSLDRQDAVKEIKSRYSGSLQAAAFAARNGDDPEQRLRDLLLRRLEHAGKRNSLKLELGLPDWTIDLQDLR